MKRYTHLIWDFNGTILDDVRCDLAAANRLLERHGLPILASVEAYRAVFGFPVIEYYRRLGFDFSKNSFAELADEWVRDYNERGSDAALFPEIPRILSGVRKKGVAHILLSATQKEMLVRQLDQFGIRGAFDEILGADNYHAHGKADIARAWRERNPSAVPLMIGDTDHDAESARALGADIILLTCGHQSRETLEKAGPLMICERPAEIPFERLF